MEALDPLNKVLQESLLYNAHGRKRYFDPNLGNNFISKYSLVCNKLTITKKKFNLHIYSFYSNIVDAFNSARSKFPRLDDILCNAGDPEQKAKLIEGKPYLFTFFSCLFTLTYKNIIFTH